jgi:hypothetical protein
MVKEAQWIRPPEGRKPVDRRNVNHACLKWRICTGDGIERGLHTFRRAQEEVPRVQRIDESRRVWVDA